MKKHKNMAKKTIKMNEAQLRKMIAEAINELDWKTVTNAANKARDNAKYLAVRKGFDVLDPNHEYGMHIDTPDNIKNITSKRRGKETKYVDWDKEAQRRLKQADNLSRFASDAISKRFDDNYGDYGNHSYYNYYNGIGEEWPELRGDSAEYEYNPRFDGEFNPDNYVERLSKMPPEERQKEQKWLDKEKEMSDYWNGKYEYKKGKGWQLKESQLRNMIAESIKKVLKEETEPITIGSPEDGKGCHVTIAGDSLGPYAEFNVYGVGTDAQAAVDAAVDYLEKNGETGYFWDNEEEAQEYPDDFVTAGNCGHLLRVDLFHVEQM